MSNLPRPVLMLAISGLVAVLFGVGALLVPGTPFSYGPAATAYVSVPALPTGKILGVTPTGVVTGFATDTDVIGRVPVRLYLDGPLQAARYIGQTYTGTTSAFSYTIPAQYRDNQSHLVYAYGVDNGTGVLSKLDGTPTTTLSQSTPTNCRPQAAKPYGPSPWIDLDFETGSITHLNQGQIYDYYFYNYLEDAIKFRFFSTGDSRMSIWLEQHNVSAGCRSLAFEISSAVNDWNIADRTELDIVPENDPHPLSVLSDARRYFGFDLMLDPSYVASADKASFNIHMQARQKSEKRSPPVSLQIASSSSATGPLTFELSILTDAQYDSAGNKIGQAKKIFSFPVERGVWHSYIFQFIPSYLGDGRKGQIALWVDGIARVVYVGDWGYKPASKGGLPDVGDVLDIRLGVYRNRNTSHQLLYVDNVRYGGSFDTVSSVRPVSGGATTIAGPGY